MKLSECEIFLKQNLKYMQNLRAPQEGVAPLNSMVENSLNPLKTKPRLLYLKTQSVPRCKHFSTRL